MINYMWVDIMNHLKEHFYDESFLQFSLNMYCSMIFFQRYVSREVAVLKLGFLNVWKSISITDQKHFNCRQGGYLCDFATIAASLRPRRHTKDLDVEEAVLSGFFHLSVRTAF